MITKSMTQAERETALHERVERDMKDHRYTLLTQGPVVEVWRCAASDSSMLAFDIAVAPLGIAVVGDIDGLIFRVGTNYGLPFLAGKDFSYIHSKLEEQCKEREWDEESWAETVAELVTNRLEGLECPEHEIPNADPDRPRLRGQAFFDAVRAYLPALICRMKSQTEFTSLDEFMERSTCIDNCREAYDFLQENESLLHTSDTWELMPRLERPSDSLMARLYMVNHAAKEILKQKEREHAA